MAGATTNGSADTAPGRGRAAAPRTRAGRYDYRRFRRAIGGAALNPRDFERPAREEGDIEITSVGVFVWRDGRSVRMDGERNG